MDKRIGGVLLPESRKEIPQEIQIELQQPDRILDVKLKLGDSTYGAFVVDGIIYASMLKVPEGERRKGVGSRLLYRLVEFAKDRGINEINHCFQSLEGLLLISSKLKMPTRKYYSPEGTEISLKNAVEILKRKKEEGQQDDTSIAVLSTTYIDDLVT